MKILLIARREWVSSFRTPVGWLAVAAFPLTASLFFFVLGAFFQQGVAEMRAVFGLMPVFLVVFAPALTMRSWAEESRSGTLDLLRSMPFSESDLTLGKFLGSFALFATAVLGCAGIPITVSLLGDLDWGPVLAGTLGTLALGAAFLALGQLCSALTRSQVVAWLLAVAALLAWLLIGFAATAEAMPAALGRIFLFLDPGLHFEAATRGVLAAGDVLFLLSMAAFFLFLDWLHLRARPLR